MVKDHMEARHVFMPLKTPVTLVLMKTWSTHVFVVSTSVLY